MVLDGFTVVAKAVVGIAKITQRFTLASPISDFLGDGQTLMVLNGLTAVARALVCIAKITQRSALASPITDFMAMARCSAPCSMALL